MNLYYSDGIQMHLGDFIRIKRFLRKDLLVTIDYLTGESESNIELEIDGLVRFAVTVSERLISWVREPETKVEEKFVFIERSKPNNPIRPEDEFL